MHRHAKDNLVLGARVQVDRSGVGHCWKNIDSGDLPYDVLLAIEAEIINGDNNECEIVASNGVRYRWK